MEVHNVKKSFVDENETLYEMLSQLSQQVRSTYERHFQLANSFRLTKAQFRRAMAQLEGLVEKEKLEKQSVSENERKT